MVQKIKRYLKRAYFNEDFPSLFSLVFSNKKKLAYYGFLGNDNFGDNIVFEATQYLFKDYLILPIQRHMPVFTYLYYKLFLKYKISGIIIGGGTLIGKASRMKEDFLWLAGQKKPIYLHGTGIRDMEPINPFWNSIMSNKLYGGLRGPLSQKKCNEDFNLKVDVLGDAAFALFNKELLSSYNSTFKNNKVVLINVGTHESYEGEVVFRKELDLFIEYLLKEKYTIKFIALHSIDKRQGELLKLKYDGIEVISFYESYTDIEDVFLNACFAIGERLHFVVTALMLDCPIYSVMYAEKHLDLLKSFSLEHLGFMASNVTYENIVYIFEHRENQKKATLNIVESYYNKQRYYLNEFSNECNQ